MSYQTAMARGEARDADQVWQAHRRSCGTCELAARRRRYDDACAAGAAMLTIRRDLADRAAREAELDRQPNPAQEALFDMEAPP